MGLGSGFMFLSLEHRQGNRHVQLGRNLSPCSGLSRQGKRHMQWGFFLVDFGGNLQSSQGHCLASLGRAKREAQEASR